MSDVIDAEGLDSPKPWERQPWDTHTSYQAFQTWYLPQAPPRSLNAAYRAFMDSRRLSAGVKKITTFADMLQLPAADQAPEAAPSQGDDRKKAASGRWKYWARACDSNGKKIPGALTWAERARAWDDELALQAREAWKKRIEEQREADWQVSNQLRDQAVSMMRRGEVEPSRIDHIAKAAETATKIGMLATGAAAELTGKGRIGSGDNRGDDAGDDYTAPAYTDAERAQRIAAILDAVRARRAGQTTDDLQDVESEHGASDGSLLLAGG